MSAHSEAWSPGHDKAFPLHSYLQWKCVKQNLPPAQELEQLYKEDRNQFKHEKREMDFRSLKRPILSAAGYRAAPRVNLPLLPCYGSFPLCILYGRQFPRVFYSKLDNSNKHGVTDSKAYAQAFNFFGHFHFTEGGWLMPGRLCTQSQSEIHSSFHLSAVYLPHLCKHCWAHQL